MDTGEDIPFGGQSEVRREPVDWSRLCSLVNADPSRLRLEEALALLRESGVADRFDDVFELARKLAVDSEVIAAIIVSNALGGFAGIDLSAQASEELAPLYEDARQALIGLQAVARHALNLQLAVWWVVGRYILGSDQAGEVNDSLEQYTGMLERYIRIGDLLNRLELVLPELAVGTGEAGGRRG